MANMNDLRICSSCLNITCEKEPDALCDIRMI